MHERGVVKRDTALYRRWERTEHGHGNRDQSRLLRKVEVRNMQLVSQVPFWYSRCIERVNETFTLCQNDSFGQVKSCAVDLTAQICAVR